MQNMQKEERKRFNAVFLAAGLYMLLSAAVGLLFSLLQLRSEVFSDFAVKRQVLLNGLVNIGIFFPMALLLFKRLPADKPKGNRALSLQELLKLFTMCYAGMFIGSYISNAFLNIFKMGDVNYIAEMIMESGRLEALLFIVVLAPLTEEIVFRKLISDRLLFMGEKTAAFMSALIFAVMHGNFFQFFYAFTVGYIFAVIYIKTGSIAYTAIIHLIINFMGSVISVWTMSADIKVAMLYSLFLMLITVIGIVYLIKFLFKCRLADRDDRRIFSGKWIGFLLSCPVFVIFIVTGILITYIKTG